MCDLIEVITIADLQKMFGGISYSTAARKMREIKAVKNRLGLKGKIVKQDLLDYLAVRGENDQH